MIKSVDPRLPSEALFLLWAMGHGDEVAVVDSRYAIDQGGDAEVHATVVQMGDVDIMQAIRAILSVVQLDTNFVADPVRQIEPARSEPLCEVRRAVQNEVDDALGFRCSIIGVAGTEFHEQVKNCYGVIITGDARKRKLHPAEGIGRHTGQHPLHGRAAQLVMADGNKHDLLVDGERIRTARLLLRPWVRRRRRWLRLVIYGAEHVSRWLAPAVERVPNTRPCGSIRAGWSNARRWSHARATGPSCCSGLERWLVA